MASTGNEESGFDFGEGALETATTSKEGSRRANCPIPALVRQRRTITTPHTSVCGDCNGRYPKPSMSINWRASLVPAAAVIPAPIAYANVVAVKKLVVGQRVSHCKAGPEG